LKEKDDLVENNNQDLEIKGHKKKSKKILWSLLFIVIAALTVWAVTAQNQSFSLTSFVAFLGTLDTKYVILAFAGMICFIL